MLSSWKNCCSRVSQKWVFTLLSFLGLAIGSALRAILSIAITEMVLPVNGPTKLSDETCSTSSVQSFKNVTLVPGTVYDWDEYTQGTILSSVYWGYAATQFFYGSLSERFGGKYLMGQSILVPAILTFFTPLVIECAGSTGLILLRVLMGASSSAMYPVASSMIPKWTVPAERARIGGFIFTGFILGSVVGTTLPALIILYSGMGWPAAFYIFGVLGMLWFPFWVLLCYEDPSVHPYVSDAELACLRESLATRNERPPSAPYKSIVTAKEFWAFVIGLAGCDWAYFTVASDMPKYMSSVLDFSIADNGYVSSLPYLCMWLNSILTSWISDWILARNLMSRTNVRKMLATVSTIGPASFILVASYAECDVLLVVVGFVVGTTLMGSAYPSIFVNNLDLSPNYAGTVMAIGNGIAALGGVLSPFIVGVLTPNQTIAEWRLVFWIGFVVAALADAVFMLYGSGEVQEWNDPNFARDKAAVVDDEKC